MNEASCSLILVKAWITFECTGKYLDYRTFWEIYFFFGRLIGWLVGSSLVGFTGFQLLLKYLMPRLKIMVHKKSQWSLYTDEYFKLNWNINVLTFNLKMLSTVIVNIILNITILLIHKTITNNIVLDKEERKQKKKKKTDRKKHKVKLQSLTNTYKWDIFLDYYRQIFSCIEKSLFSLFSNAKKKKMKEISKNFHLLDFIS